MKRAITLLAVLCLLNIAPAAPQTHAESACTITRLTTNEIVDYYPQISGGQAVWFGGAVALFNEFEIFFYDGVSVIQLTTNTTDDHDPRISGGQVVWWGGGGSDGGSDTEIFFYDGVSIIQLTTNTTSDRDPQIDGGQVVWQGGSVNLINEFEIFFYDGVSIIQLTNNTSYDHHPQISGGQVVWAGRGGSDGGSDNEIFFYDGVSTTQLTTNTTDDQDPQISGGQVVWWGGGGSDGGSDTEIFFYDGVSVIQLTTNTIPDYSPQIDGGQVVWQGGEDSGTDDSEIYLYDGVSVIQLTSNTLPDIRPQIDGGQVVWQGVSSPVSSGMEIYFYDGVFIHQMTNNDYDDQYPQISGGQVVWMGRVGYDEATWEIFLGGTCVPATSLVASAACSGDHLAVSLSEGDGPFSLSGTGPGLPRSDIGTGVYNLTGPGTWENVTVTETTGTLESLSLGTFTCGDEGNSVQGALVITDPALSKRGELGPGQIGLPGEQITWVITATAHEQTLNNIVITDVFPPDLRVDHVQTTAGTAAITGQTVEVTIPSLAAGAAVEVRVTTTILRSPILAIITNTATLTLSATGWTVDATGQVSVVTGLPSTGYPPGE